MLVERFDGRGDKLPDGHRALRVGPEVVPGPVAVPLRQVLPQKRIRGPTLPERVDQPSASILVLPLDVPEPKSAPPVAIAVSSAACSSTSLIRASVRDRSGAGSPPKGSGYTTFILAGSA